MRAQRRAAAVAAFLATVAAWLLQTPCPIDPISFKFCEERLREYEGVLEINTELQRARHLFPGGLNKPESFVTDSNGYIFTGLGDGRLARISPDLSSYSTFLRLGPPPHENCGATEEEHRCGRALGLQFHPTSPHILYSADSSFGLTKIDTLSKQVSVLVPRGLHDDNDNNTPFVNFANDLVVMGNGSIYFTDSSKKFSRRDVVYEVYEGRGNGQLLHYDPVRNRTSVLLDGIYFPNGLCLSLDGTALLVVETSRARVIRYYLTGKKAGTTDIFVDNLPGLPDNISPNSRGTGYWVPFAITRQWLTDSLTELPSIRSLLVQMGLARILPHSLPKHALVLELDESGNIVRSLHDDGGRVLGSISHVLDLGDQLLLGSYEASYAAVLSLNSSSSSSPHR